MERIEFTETADKNSTAFMRSLTVGIILSVKTCLGRFSLINVNRWSKLAFERFSCKDQCLNWLNFISLSSTATIFYCAFLINRYCVWNNLKGKKNRKIILGHHLVKDGDFSKGSISNTHTDTCRWYLNPNKKKKSLCNIQHCPIFVVIIKKSKPSRFFSLFQVY